MKPFYNCSTVIVKILTLFQWGRKNLNWKCCKFPCSASLPLLIELVIHGVVLVKAQGPFNASWLTSITSSYRQVYLICHLMGETFEYREVQHNIYKYFLVAFILNGIFPQDFNVWFRCYSIGLTLLPLTEHVGLLFKFSFSYRFFSIFTSQLS
jgi:hypothetical protein